MSINTNLRPSCFQTHRALRSFPDKSYIHSHFHPDVHKPVLCTHISFPHLQSHHFQGSRTNARLLSVNIYCRYQQMQHIRPLFYSLPDYSIAQLSLPCKAHNQSSIAHSDFDGNVRLLPLLQPNPQRYIVSVEFL